MPLHMTKIAFGSDSAVTLRAWLESHAEEALLTTRYMPKRVAEMEGGSLYWILGGVMVGRSPLRGFAEKPDGKVWIRLEPRLIAVEARPRRAHQGWRYLEDSDKPADATGDSGDTLPPALASELARLGLL
ncbi:DUF1489 domain-containing protein [Sphingobium sufflavum]|uniref:DUF1489 family protein n=1 Tax=Sphingobium sufflavum TaxID=1129547 RepID=UPI001F33902D|nr:DUF1489 domain-containing protein [Sphingobium sufflavum]MCE7794984.1 DUF1489 domain-containing protein [Sphingobium sufflavum]